MSAATTTVQCPICMMLLPGLDELNQHLDLSHPPDRQTYNNNNRLTLAVPTAKQQPVSPADVVALAGTQRTRPSSSTSNARAHVVLLSENRQSTSRPPSVVKTTGQDYLGQFRNHTVLFHKLRQPAVDHYRLERNRLLGRLERLWQLHHRTVAQSKSVAGGEPSISRQNSSGLREAEMEIGHWQPDNEVGQCPICSRPFSYLSTLLLATKTALFSGGSSGNGGIDGIGERKHHCRLCGRVICGQPSCSRFISLRNHYDRKEVVNTGDQESKRLRICADCERITAGSESHQIGTGSGTGTTASNELSMLYQSMADIKQLVTVKLLPKFNQLLLDLEPFDGPSIRNSPELFKEYQTAADIRKKLLVLFEQLDRSSKRISQLHCRHQSDRKLHNAIFQSTKSFLQTNMFTLQMLPRFEGRPSRSSSESLPSIVSEDRGELAKELRVGDKIRVSSSAGALQKLTSFFAGPSSAGNNGGRSGDAPLLDLENIFAISQQVPSHEELPEIDRQTFVILKEQKEQLEAFIQEAAINRRLNDVRTLQHNLDELNCEMERLLRKNMN